MAASGRERQRPPVHPLRLLAQLVVVSDLVGVRRHLVEIAPAADKVHGIADPPRSAAAVRQTGLPGPSPITVSTPEPAHVIVDEGQDLLEGFFRYLRDFVATTITVFADEDQALSDERSTLRDIKAAARLDDPALLSANHRNTPEIARVAEHYHAGDAPVPEVHRAPSGELPRVILYRDDATRRMANWYRARGGRVGVAVINYRTGEHLYAKLRAQLPEQRVEIYTSYRRNEDEIDLLAPGITILNVQSIKGQEFDTVFIMEVDELLLEAGEANKRKMYMLCARARDNLFLMHDGDRLPRALIERSPGADVLEWP